MKRITSKRRKKKSWFLSLALTGAGLLLFQCQEDRTATFPGDESLATATGDSLQLENVEQNPMKSSSLSFKTNITVIDNLGGRETSTSIAVKDHQAHASYWRCDLPCYQCAEPLPDYLSCSGLRYAAIQYVLESQALVPSLGESAVKQPVIINPDLANEEDVSKKSIWDLPRDLAEIGWGNSLALDQADTPGISAINAQSGEVHYFAHSSPVAQWNGWHQWPQAIGHSAIRQSPTWMTCAADSSPRIAWHNTAVTSQCRDQLQEAILPNDQKNKWNVSTVAADCMSNPYAAYDKEGKLYLSWQAVSTKNEKSSLMFQAPGKAPEPIIVNEYDIGLTIEAMAVDNSGVVHFILGGTNLLPNNCLGCRDTIYVTNASGHWKMEARLGSANFINLIEAYATDKTYTLFKSGPVKLAIDSHGKAHLAMLGKSHDKATPTRLIVGHNLAGDWILNQIDTDVQYETTGSNNLSLAVEEDGSAAYVAYFGVNTFKVAAIHYY